MLLWGYISISYRLYGVVYSSTEEGGILSLQLVDEWIIHFKFLYILLEKKG